MEPSKGAETNPILIEWVRHSRELLDLTDDLAGCEILAPDTPHHKEVAKIVAFKFAQAVRTFLSVLLLAEVGDATNSFILMRSLFESLVDVAYLIENPKDVWRYLEESAELEAKLRHAQLRYGPPTAEDISRKRLSPEELHTRFSGLAAEHSSCKSWRRLSLRTRAEKTGYPASSYCTRSSIQLPPRMYTVLAASCWIICVGWQNHQLSFESIMSEPTPKWSRPLASAPRFSFGSLLSPGRALSCWA